MMPSKKKTAREKNIHKYPDTWYEDITSNPKFFSLASIYKHRIIGLVVAEIKPQSKCNKEDQGLLSPQFPKTDQVAYILTLGVVSDFRKNGIATLLLDNLISHLTSNSDASSCKAVYLHVLTTNATAIQFYERRNFHLHSYLPLYYSIHGVAKDGFSYVLYINGGYPPWTLADYIRHIGQWISRIEICTWPKRILRASIMSYNGGTVIAMKGKDCVAIAADRRLGVQLQTVAVNFQKVYEMGPHLYIGLPGLATDTITVAERLKFRVNMYELREGRSINPKTFSSVVSNLLYERRFGPYFVEPVIAGLDPKTLEPYICNMDLIGCPNEPNDFVVSGSCSEQAYGMCEALWEPSLEPDDLFETISQALVNAFDRDAITGWGCIVHVIEKDKVTTRTVKTRMD